MRKGKEGGGSLGRQIPGALAGGTTGTIGYTAQRCWDKNTYAADPEACAAVLFGSGMNPTVGGIVVIFASAALGFGLVEGAKWLSNR